MFLFFLYFKGCYHTNLTNKKSFNFSSWKVNPDLSMILAVAECSF